MPILRALTFTEEGTKMKMWTAQTMESVIECNIFRNSAYKFQMNVFECSVFFSLATLIMQLTDLGSVAGVQSCWNGHKSTHAETLYTLCFIQPSLASRQHTGYQLGKSRSHAPEEVNTPPTVCTIQPIFVLPNSLLCEAVLSESVDHVGMQELMGQILHKHLFLQHIAEAGN